MSGPDEPAHIPPSVSLDTLAPWERHLWLIPGLTVEERRAAGMLIRLQRGELSDDTGALLQLYHTIGNALRRQP